MLIERATVWPSASQAPDLGARLSQPREGGRQKIEKRSYSLEVLALKVPFRNLLVFPNQAPWPGRLRTYALYISFRCRDDTRDSKIRPAATHLLSVDCLYQGEPKSARGNLNRVEVYWFGARRPERSVSSAPPGLPSWLPRHPRLPAWAAIFRRFAAAFCVLSPLRGCLAGR